MFNLFCFQIYDTFFLLHYIFSFDPYVHIIINKNNVDFLWRNFLGKGDDTLQSKAEEAFEPKIVINILTAHPKNTTEI